MMLTQACQHGIDVIAVRKIVTGLPAAISLRPHALDDAGTGSFGRFGSSPQPISNGLMEHGKLAQVGDEPQALTTQLDQHIPHAHDVRCAGCVARGHLLQAPDGHSQSNENARSPNTCTTRPHLAPKSSVQRASHGDILKRYGGCIALPAALAMQNLLPKFQLGARVRRAVEVSCSVAILP